MWIAACLITFTINSLLLFYAAPSDKSHFEPDSYVYDSIARHFAQTGNIYDHTHTLVPMQPIGYHLFVGLIYKLLYVHYSCVVFIQLLMVLGIGLLMYRIARILFDKTVASTALGLFSIHLGFLVYTQLILAEILLTFLFMIFFERMVMFSQSHVAIPIQKRRPLSTDVPECSDSESEGFFVPNANQEPFPFSFTSFVQDQTEELYSVRPEQAEARRRIGEKYSPTLRDVGEGNFAVKCKWFNEAHYIYLWQAAAVLSISTLVKPIAFIFVCPFIAILWCLSKVSLREVGVVIGIFFAPVIAYMLRNYYLYDVFSFAPMMQVNLYQCLLSKVIARIEGMSLHAANDLLMPTSANLFDPSLWEKQRELFWFYFTRSPQTFVLVWLQNCVKTMFGLFTTQWKIFFNPALSGDIGSFFSEYTGIMAYLARGAVSSWMVILGIVEAVWHVVRLFFVAGAVKFFGYKQTLAGIMFGTFIVCCVFATGVDGCFRYRLPCEPLLMIATAAGMIQTIRYFQLKYEHIYG